MGKHRAGLALDVRDRSEFSSAHVERRGKDTGTSASGVPRTCGDTAEDVFFVDAPGEWFRSWAVNREGSEAAGARWISEHADVFLVVADSEGLAGPERGSSRNVLTQILQRVGAEREGRPVALVWAKSDVEVPESMRSTIAMAARQHLGDHDTFSWTVKPGAADGAMQFTSLLEWTLVSRGHDVLSTGETTVPTTDHFMAFRHAR